MDDLATGATTRRPHVAVVGPCASGKSTLRASLEAAGYTVSHPAQEHSYVPDMWRRLVRPDVLIFLDVDLAASLVRRPGDPEFAARRLAVQQERLAHARAHADVIIDTSRLTPDAVREQALAFLHTSYRPL